MKRVNKNCFTIFYWHPYLIIKNKVFYDNETKNKVIILDNASSHRNDKIKTFINKQNKLIYLFYLLFL